MYVGLQQFAAVLLPLPTLMATSQGNAMERVENRTLKAGSSPPEQRRKFSRPQKTTPLIDFPTDFKD
jgi:hypothetical protein